MPVEGWGEKALPSHLEWVANRGYQGLRHVDRAGSDQAVISERVAELVLEAYAPDMVTVVGDRV